MIKNIRIESPIESFKFCYRICIIYDASIY